MSNWGKTKTIIIQREIKVDADIAEDIRWLNKRGVETVASCSGHGKTRPNTLIKPSSKVRAEELGYHPQYHNGFFKIYLD